MALLGWVYDTQAKYDALATKDSNTLYFTSDTKQLYRGSELFTEVYRMVDAFPTTGQEQGIIYILSTTLEGRVWNGTAWKTIINPMATSLTDDTTENGTVSGEAIKSYVNAKLTAALTSKYMESMTYDAANKQLVYVKDGANVNVPITGFLTGASYAGDTGVLTFTLQGGDNVAINLPKENFLKSGTYDETNKQLVLTLQDDTKVTIPVADLVNVHSFADTTTTKITVDGSDVVTVDVKLSSNANNGITVDPTNGGLFVDKTQFSGSNKLDKLAAGTANQIVVTNADGSIVSSAKAIGGATLATTPDANTVATEVAVKAIANTLISASAIVANGADINTTTPSTTKVISEKALVDALTWKTLS